MQTEAKSKRGLAVILVALIACLALVGTLAILALTSNSVTNTFKSAGLVTPDPDPDPDQPLVNDGFYLYEHKAVYNDDTTLYTIDQWDDSAANLVTEQDYVISKVATEIPKDPFVNLKGLNFDSYLYVEVVASEGFSTYFTEPDLTDNWVELSGVTGKNGGQIYVYKNGGADADGAQPVAEGTELSKLYIIDGNKIEIPTAIATEELIEGMDKANLSLKFYGYLAQATPDAGGSGYTQTAAEAFAAAAAENFA